MGIEANQWFEIEVLEQADERSLFTTMTASFAPAFAQRFELKVGAGAAWHWERNPENCAHGAMAQLGTAYRFRKRGFSPTVIVDYFLPLNGTRQPSRDNAGGPFEARVLKVGVGRDGRRP